MWCKNYKRFIDYVLHVIIVFRILGWFYIATLLFIAIMYILPIILISVMQRIVLRFIYAC